jgi:DNA (cytosine-5)-methyltransferase 1
MKYATVCSGIGAPECAWTPLNWEPVFSAEIDAFPSAVLSRRFPNTPNLGDMTKIDGTKYRGAVDLICGGTPCQSFSLAGLRRGMFDSRGNLALDFVRILFETKPRWFIWENVPGVLSSNKGRDFGSLIGAFRHVGYSCAWRVLDAQFFGVPQQRRRVFVVGHLGEDWRPPAQVLFDGEGMRGDIESGRKTGKVVTALTRSSAGASGANDNDARAGHLIIDFRHGTTGDVCKTLLSCTGGPSLHCTPYIMATGQANAEISVGVSPTLTCAHESPIVFDPAQITSQANRSVPKPGIAHTLNAGGIATLFSPEIRRLTPLEYERLQGFPDNWTLVPYRGRMAKDTPRYKAVGNSMAVPVMRWVGERIEMFNNQ